MLDPPAVVLGAVTGIFVVIVVLRVVVLVVAVVTHVPVRVWRLLTPWPVIRLRRLPVVVAQCVTVGASAYRNMAFAMTVVGLRLYRSTAA